uniref:RING-type domain-containing protein n=2 Tax=Quercus lobata TaxID=97700 RepID=A0A7N2MRS4_QUELO
MQSNQIFNNKNKCAHAVCKDCIAKYIQDKIDTKDKVPNIQCPGLNCNQFLDPLFCRKIIQKPRCFFMNFRCGTCFCEDNSNKREDLRRKCIQQQKRMQDNSNKCKDNQHVNVIATAAVSAAVSAAFI